LEPTPSAVVLAPFGARKVAAEYSRDA